ncbi:hypothetical protein KAFR_0E00320 [Kazachstania africana CBS 2517]|uniref:LicD/FKTN/FKRP nucleotidyltransferase domain-containing protein n=1 Tax=Kazachstania africana (strain ATCC 22294 / BCRC 22015 / CBS 2517 / CECT 1963 / NBRC 1671 / NRRL Y-8276) TaxID=1071382 RepID=H2AUY6_KAZAF|nr:hypothetical protein KAFR_0E00320 [Kazachstania africana CBS 2517]CCF58186.1 hypothetical protein KAFR_0E00320 [Kazachstania africana CBS 2517]
MLLNNVYRHSSRYLIRFINFVHSYKLSRRYFLPVLGAHVLVSSFLLWFLILNRSDESELLKNDNNRYYIDDPDYKYFNDFISNDATSWLPIPFISSADGEDSVSELNKLSKLYEKLKFNTKPIWVDDYSLKKNLMTVSMGPHKFESFNFIDNITFYDFDPRLTWSTYLNHILHNLNDENEELPFSWYDWSDFHELNKLISLESQKINCNLLFEGTLDVEALDLIEKEVGEPLFVNERFKYTYPKWYHFSRKMAQRHIFTVLKKHCTPIEKAKFSTGVVINEMYDNVRPEVFQLQARNFVLTTAPNPLSITMCSDTNHATYQFNVQKRNSSNLIESKLLHNFISNQTDNMLQFNDTSEIPEDFDIVFNHNILFNEFISNVNISKKFKLEVDRTDKNAFNSNYVELSADDFEFDPYSKIKDMESRKDSLSLHQLNYLASLKTSVTYHPATAPKYFAECGAIQQFKGMGYHRDKRFFNGDNMLNNQQDYFNRLNAMIRTFQKFTAANGIISWLGHGTLYGYIYNGQTFPWDNDFDLQMPITHLNYLSEYFNQTLVLEDPRFGNGRYLLDVGTSITIRTNGNGKNNIDARFIDIDSGLYIDITGLSVSMDVARDTMKTYITDKAKEQKIELTKEVKTYPDTNHLKDFDGETFSLLNITELKKYADEHTNIFSADDIKNIGKLIEKEEETVQSKSVEKWLNPEERFDLHKKLHLFNCRNSHFTNLDLLSPLINTMYHGVPTLIPFKYISALKNEYSVPAKYGYTTFKDNIYLPEFRLWFKQRILDRCSNLKSWFPTDIFEPLKNTTSLERIDFDTDAKTMLDNLIMMDDYDNVNIDILAQIYNSFETTSYRLKEVEIQYSNTSPEQKKIQLDQLRERFSSSLNNPAKDPLIYRNELNIYEELSSKYDASTIKDLERNVQYKYIDKFWSLTRDLKYRNSTLFNTTTSVSLESANLTSIDFNVIGRDDLFADSRKNANELFKTDPVMTTEN